MRLLLISFLLASSCSHSISFRNLASGPSHYCFGYDQAIFIKVESDDPAAKDCEANRVFDEHLKKVGKISPRPLPRVGLILTPNYDRLGTFNVLYGKVTLPAGPYSQKELKQYLAILTHEQGHNLFARFLAREIPLFQDFEKLDLNADTFLEGMFSVVAKHGGAEACRNSSICLEDLEIYKNGLPEEIRNAEKLTNTYLDAHREEFNALHSATTPFNEFYADVVAAVYYSNPDYLIRETKDLIGLQECRLFSKPYRLDEEGKSDPYCLLAEIRADLWRAWIKPRLGNKHALLEELGTAMAKEAALAMQAGEVNPEVVLPRLKRRLGIR